MKGGGATGIFCREVHERIYSLRLALMCFFCSVEGKENTSAGVDLGVSCEYFPFIKM